MKHLPELQPETRRRIAACAAVLAASALLGALCGGTICRNELAGACRASASDTFWEQPPSVQMERICLMRGALSAWAFPSSSTDGLKAMEAGARKAFLSMVDEEIIKALLEENDSQCAASPAGAPQEDARKIQIRIFLLGTLSAQLETALAGFRTPHDEAFLQAEQAVAAGTTAMQDAGETGELRERIAVLRHAAAWMDPASAESLRARCTARCNELQDGTAGRDGVADSPSDAGTVDKAGHNAASGADIAPAHPDASATESGPREVSGRLVMPAPAPAEKSGASVNAPATAREVPPATGSGASELKAEQEGTAPAEAAGPEAVRKKTDTAGNASAPGTINADARKDDAAGAPAKDGGEGREAPVPEHSGAGAGGSAGPEAENSPAGETAGPATEAPESPASPDAGGWTTLGPAPLKGSGSMGRPSARVLGDGSVEVEIPFKGECPGAVAFLPERKGAACVDLPGTWKFGRFFDRTLRGGCAARIQVGIHPDRLRISGIAAGRAAVKLGTRTEISRSRGVLRVTFRKEG